MRRYKVGILGTGVISRTYLADIKAFYHSLQVVACADLLQERAQTLAKEFSVPRACTVEELLQAQDIEIIVNLTAKIATPAPSARSFSTTLPEF